MYLEVYICTHEEKCEFSNEIMPRGWGKRGREKRPKEIQNTQRFLFIKLFHVVCVLYGKIFSASEKFHFVFLMWRVFWTNLSFYSISPRETWLKCINAKIPGRNGRNYSAKENLRIYPKKTSFDHFCFPSLLRQELARVFYKVQECEILLEERSESSVGWKFGMRKLN